MSAGTLTLTNNSASVSGSGTSFTTELAAADFIVVTVGGIPYTLPVKTVDSTTALTLVSNYTGPTQAGAAWYAVPRVAMNLVTAALVAQSAEALRGLNYDKQNWQQIFAGSGTATIKIPDGTSFTGPTWNSLSTELGNKADKTELANKADKTALNDYAKKGANQDITSLTGLTTPLSLAQGGVGSGTAAGARSNIGAPKGIDSQMCTAWCLFSASGALEVGYGVSSVTKLGTGQYRIYFSSAMVASFAPTVSAVDTIPTGGNGANSCVTVTNVSFIEVMFFNITGSALGDPSRGAVHVFGGR